MCNIVSGVPQGSILGSLLFLIYIDDIVKVTLSEGSKLVLYANDVLLYRPIRTNKDYSALQHDVEVVSEWANINSMQFNSAKCKFILVSRRRMLLQVHPCMCLNGSPLESVPTFKYLGVLLSSDLTWSVVGHANSLVCYTDDTTNTQTVTLCYSCTCH